MSLEARSVKDTIYLATRARAAVVGARAAIRVARAENDVHAKLRYENLANALYQYEEEIAHRILLPLEARGLFGVVGAGSVAPLSLAGPLGIPVRFLGRDVPLEQALALQIFFEPWFEENSTVIERRGVALGQAYFQGVSAGRTRAVGLAWGQT